MAFSIEDWVDEHLDRPRNTGRQEYTAVCPSCGAEPGRFYVNVESGAFVCFKEDDFRGRTIWPLISHVEGITIPQARAEAFRANVKFTRRRRGTLETLAARVAGLRGREVDAGESSRVAALLPRGFIPVYDAARRREWKRPVYLKIRGVSRPTCKEFGLGYVPAGEWYPSEESERPQYIGERVIIPILSPSGFSWSARDLTGRQMPKYVNPRGAPHGRLLHGWNQVDLNSDVVLVEGPLDVIGLYQLGIPSLAVLGKKLNREQLGLLCKKPADAAITVMMDPEEISAPFEIARELHARFKNVFVASLPRGVDPGTASRKQAWAAWDGAARYTGERNSGLIARLQILHNV